MGDGSLTDLSVVADRFWPKVVVGEPEECWEWTAAMIRGYGTFRGPGGRNGRMLRAHRVAYELLVAPIPEDLQLDHLCRNPACVNPAHLEPVTNHENQQRRPDVGGTHCPNGHPYDEANTYIYETAKERRRCCRACNSEAQRRYASRKEGEPKRAS